MEYESNTKVIDESTYQTTETSKLSLEELKKYYKWCILGTDINEALVRARKPELIPKTEGPHPNCKLPWEQIKEVSLLFQPEHRRTEFQIETFFGGKDPEELVKRIFSDLNSKRHPGCADSWEDLKKMSHQLPTESSRLIFVVETFYGGKAPAELLKNMLACGPDTTPCVGDLNPVDRTAKKAAAAEVPAADCESTDFYGNPSIIEEGPIRELHNGKLKFYYIWRNGGFNHEHALSKARCFVSYTGNHLPHPECNLSQEHLKKMSLPLTDEILMHRFLIHTYYGGKDPASTLSYLKSRSEETDQPEIVPAKKSDSASDGNCTVIDDVNLSTGKLKYYYLWLNKGFDHKTVLSKVRRLEAFPGTHSPHPCCKHTKDELVLMSQALKSDEYSHRFVVLTYFGGKNPANTMEYFMSVSRKVKFVEAEHFAVVEKNMKTNDELKSYYLFRKDGCSHTKAMSLISARQSFVGPSFPHPNCKHSIDQLRHMSKVLLLEPLFRDRFVIHTFFGGKDPEDTLSYYTSRSSLEQELPTTISNELPVPATTSVEPQLPESRDIGAKKIPASARPLPFEPVAKRTRSKKEIKTRWNPVLGIIPLRSPNHLSKELNDVQLRKYYMWVSRGCPHEEAMVKAKTPGLTPQPISSRCSVPMAELNNMSQKLSDINLRRTFITETYYAGNDPEIVMEFLLSKGVSRTSTTSNLKSQSHMRLSSNQALCKPNSSNNSDVAALPVSTCSEQGGNRKSRGHERSASVDPFSCPTTIEEGPISELPNDKLRYYYLWRNGGFTHEYALSKARSFFNYPGSHFPHPRCKLSQENLKTMSQALSHDKISMERFFILTYFGGKDPDRTMSHFMQILPQQRPQEIQTERSINQPVPSSSPATGSPAVNHPNLPLAVGMPQVVMPSLQPAAPSLPQTPIPPYQQQSVGHPTVAHGHLPIGTPFMVYTPSQPQIDAIPSVLGVLPYQPPVPGPPNVVYPPDLTHAPLQISMADSRYPHAAAGSYSSGSYPPNLPDVTKPPPCMKEHLPTVDITSATPQSPFALKAADQYPIKIKLHPSSIVSVQPKKVPMEKQSLLDDGSSCLFIVSTCYPRECLTDSQLDAIENSLLEAILENDDDDMKPSFTDACRSNGRYGITCIDQFSVKWLHKFLGTYQPWPGASLKVIPNQNAMIRANAILPLSKDDDDEKILKYIGKQNIGLNINMWTVINRWESEDSNTCMDLFIDEESANVLQKCSKIYFKLKSAAIVTTKRDSKSSSSLGDQNSAGKHDSPTIPAESTTRPPLQSSPPALPPKFIRLGEDFPNPPKRLSELEGSLQNNSACSMPTQDRFGHAIPEPHASEPPLQDHSHLGRTNNSSDGAEGDKHSWLEWFYSKDELGVPRSSHNSPSCDKTPSLPIQDRIRFEPKSLSPAYRASPVRYSGHLCRDRSPSPATYNQAKCSRRDRKRSDSLSSLSPEHRRLAPRTPSPNRYSGKPSYSKKRKRLSSRSPSSSDEYSPPRHRQVVSDLRAEYSSYH